MMRHVKSATLVFLDSRYHGKLTNFMGNGHYSFGDTIQGTERNDCNYNSLEIPSREQSGMVVIASKLWSML